MISAGCSALGITTMVVGQALVNLSVVLGLMPTKGHSAAVRQLRRLEPARHAIGNGRALNISQHADET